MRALSHYDNEYDNNGTEFRISDMAQCSLLAANCCRSQLSESESEPDTPLTLSSATIVSRKEVQKNKSDDDRRRILKINIKLIDK